MKLCSSRDIATAVVLYLWIEWELAVMRTLTKVYLFDQDIIESDSCLPPKARVSVLKRELVYDLCLIHGMVGKVINHIRT